MKQLTTFLDGKKTYLAAVAMVIVTGLKGTGIIDEGTYQLLVSLFGGVGLAALRSAVKK